MPWHNYARIIPAKKKQSKPRRMWTKSITLNQRILNEDPLIQNGCLSRNGIIEINFEHFVKKQSALEAARYPFLSKKQVRQRVLSIWKKKRESDLNSLKKTKKSVRKPGKLSAQSFSDCERTNNKDKSKEAFLTKRHLVPLNVDFVPAMSNGALKKNCSSNGVKRRVSFNKELYIRYRTTSEESSNSTLKEKNRYNQNEDCTTDVLSNLSKQCNFYSYSKGCNQTKTNKYNKSEMEKKFDQLVNEKCSWSYRSQIVTSNTKTNANDSTLQLESTFMTVEIAENNYDEFDDIEDKSPPKNVFKTTRRTNSTKNHKKLSKMIPNKSCTLRKQSANSKNTRTVKKRMKGVISKQVPTPSSGRILRERNLKLQNVIDVSSSSSEDEVLQTRFSLKDKNICIESEDSDQDSQTIVSDKEEILSDIDITLASLDVKKTSPIIIQAIPYKKNDYNASTNETETVKQSSAGIGKLRNKNETNDMTDQLKRKSSEELKKIESISADSLSVEASTLNSVIDSSCNEIINSEQIDIVKNNNKYTNTENISSQIDVKNIENDNLIIRCTDESKLESDDHIIDDSMIQDTDESKIVSDDQVIDDFLNGTFDVSIYTPKETPLTENDKGETDSHAITKVKNHEIQSNTVSSDLTSSNDIDNSFSKRKQNLFYGGNKRYKSNNLQDVEKEFFDIPTTDNMPFSRKLNKELKTLTKRSTKNNKNTLGTSVDDFDLGLNGECVNKIAQQTKKRNKNGKKLSQFKDTSTNPINLSDSDNEDQGCKIVNHSRIRKKNNKNANTSVKSTAVHTRRNMRSSSLIASRRIKEIEKLENVSENQDETDIQSEQNTNHTTVLQKIKENMDTSINKFKLKIASKNSKENNVTSNHIVKKKNINSYDSEYTNLNILDSDDNASFYSFTKDKTENENMHILDSGDNASFHSLIKVKTENAKQTTRNKRKFQGNLSKCKGNRLNEINDDRLQKKSHKLISDFNFSNEEYSSGDEVQKNWTVQKKQKGNKKYSNKEIEKARDKISCNNKMNEKEARQNSKDMKHEKFVTESKKMTWTDLENELLNELDNEIPLSNARNVSQIITLKREKLVRKKGIVNDTNLVTVSNTSMTQTISKSAKGDTYNMQYAIQNTESKYMKTRRNASKFQNSVIKEIAPINPKNLSILEKTIAAMEECTNNYIVPQLAITWQNKWSNSNSQLEEISENLNSDHDKLPFNSTTFLALEKSKQYTSDEITSDIKHSRQKKSKNYKKNVSKISSDYGLSKQKNIKSSDNAEHLTNDIYKKGPLKNSTNKGKTVENQALVPFTGKTDDPWGKLMKDLNIDQNTKQNGCFTNTLNGEPQNMGKLAHITDLSSTEKLNKQLVANKTYFKNNYIGQINKNSEVKGLESLNNESECSSVRSTLSNQIDLLEKHSDEFDFNVCDNLSELDIGSRKDENTFKKREPNKRNANKKDSFKISPQENKKCDYFTENINSADDILDLENLNEKESGLTSLNIMPTGEIDLLMGFNGEFIFDAPDNLEADNESKEEENTVEKTIFNKQNKTEVRKDLVTSARKKENKNTTALPPTGTKSPKFKFKAGLDGVLKFKLHSSKSLSASSSSEDFSKKKNVPNNAKNKHYTRNKTNKARERYIKYIKNIDEKEDSVSQKDTTNTQDNDKHVKPPSNLTPDEGLNFVQDESNGTKNIKFIAEKDGDVFSLSSSDSEDDDKEKTRGSGLLCDFFD